MKGWIVAVVGGGVAAGVLAAGVLAAVHDGPQAATAQNPPPAASGLGRTVTVDGVGVVSGPPDTVTLSLGVKIEAPSASEALDTASQKAQRLVDTLTAAGVAKSDIQTGYISVYPTYRDSTNDPKSYSASNSLTAVVHDVGGAGAIIDAVTKAVGDGVTLGGVSFSISDTSALYEQARQMAVAQARRRADQLATGANVSVGGVVAMNESAQEVPKVLARDSAAPAAATPIEPGSQQVQLTV